LVTILKEDLASYDAASKGKMRIYGGVYNVGVGGCSNTDNIFREIMVSNELEEHSI
jgi:hypothetical protein